MRRRDFIAAVGGAVVTSFAARAQQLPLVGFMSSRAQADSEHLIAAFRRGLAEAGFVEGQNVSVAYGWAGGRYDRLDAIVAEFVSRNVAVIVAVGGVPSARAAKEGAATTPIVFSIGPDPVKLGLVASLNHPGGNATGITLLTTELEPKRLGLVRELVPNAALIAVLINPDNPPSTDQAKDVQQAASSLGSRLLLLYARTRQELDAAFAIVTRERPDALLVGADPFFDTQRNYIIDFATGQRLPALYQFREYAVAGGLISYGISVTEGYRLVGEYAGRILRGEKPSDLPVVQSTKFELIINLRTARALGLQIPDKLLALADEVIE
jgi:putative ABC transport system substrate-binding protein